MSATGSASAWFRDRPAGPRVRQLIGTRGDTPEQGASGVTVRGILRRHLQPDRASEVDAGQGCDPAVRTARVPRSY